MSDVAYRPHIVNKSNINIEFNLIKLPVIKCVNVCLIQQCILILYFLTSTKFKHTNNYVFRMTSVKISLNSVLHRLVGRVIQAYCIGLAVTLCFAVVL